MRPWQWAGGLLTAFQPIANSRIFAKTFMTKLTHRSALQIANQQPLPLSRPPSKYQTKAVGRSKSHRFGCLRLVLAPWRLGVPRSPKGGQSYKHKGVGCYCALQLRLKLLFVLQLFLSTWAGATAPESWGTPRSTAIKRKSSRLIWLLLPWRRSRL